MNMKKSWIGVGIAVLLSGCTTMEGNLEIVPKSAMAPESASDYAEDAAAPVHLNRSVAVKSSGSGYFQKSNRMMAYTAGFTLSVKEREKALDDVKLLAEKLGGYLVSSNRGNMNVKIPVARADEFLKSSAAFGEVSDFRISADDLTDTITDLQVRLDNLRKLRQRLSELLAKTKNVDEMLKVERELNRVTTEIERMDANLKNNQNRVNYVNFSVTIVEEAGLMPGGTPQAIDRFEFLDDLASASTGALAEPLFGLDVPDDFVVMPGGGAIRCFAATSSDDCIFTTWQVKVADGSTLDFWGKMIARTLQYKKSFDQIKVFPAEFDGRKAVRITAQVTTRRGIELYMAVISIKERWGAEDLRIVEFFGPEEAYKTREKAVLKTLEK